jgi:hypothetical protein
VLLAHQAPTPKNAVDPAVVYSVNVVDKLSSNTLLLIDNIVNPAKDSVD